METDSTSASGNDAVQGQRQDAASQAAPSEEPIRLARQLTPKQRIVLQALAEGCSAPEAARRANVDPSTVNRWLNHNARFIAAHNAWITGTLKAGWAAVIALIPLAAKAVRDAIEAGNGWLALQVLRDAKLTTPPDASAITPKAARQQIKMEKQKRESELAQKEMQIKLQQQEIEKLQAQIKSYEEKKQFEKEQNMEYFEAWADFWSKRSSENRWQESHAHWRKERFEKELQEIQRLRETKQQRDSARQPREPMNVWGEEWKPRLEQQRRDAEEDEQLLKAIKANPDGIAATGVKLPPGVQWPKNWPGAEKASTDPDASVRAASSVVESAAGPSDHPETSG